jgi:hypothetical protein
MKKDRNEISFSTIRWRSAYKVIERLSKTIEAQERRFGRQEKNIKELGNNFYTQMQELTKERDEAIRAYNGLHKLGKFAVEQGIDIKNEKLPESEKNKYDFSQKNTVLESGRTKHSFLLKKKKNGGVK